MLCTKYSCFTLNALIVLPVYFNGGLTAACQHKFCDSGIKFL